MRFEEQVNHVVVRYPELRMYGPQPPTPRSFHREVSDGVAIGRRLHGKFVRETARTAVRSIVAVIGAIAREHAYRKTVRALRELEDYRLEDIGIERGDIRTVARALAYGEPQSKVRLATEPVATETETTEIAKAA